MRWRGWCVLVIAGIRPVRRLNTKHKELDYIHVSRSNARLRQPFYRLLNVQGIAPGVLLFYQFAFYRAMLCIARTVLAQDVHLSVSL